MKQNGPEIGLLAALGFGPEAALMHEPRLLLDGRFLGTLIAELEDELGVDDARNAFFQIGFLHGLRDAQRIVESGFLGSEVPLHTSSAESPPLAIRLGARTRDAETGAIVLAGTWPEAFEAEARLERLGPEEQSSCSLSAGYTSGWLSGSLDADILVRETHCVARGDACCTFQGAEPAFWRHFGDEHIAEHLRLVPFQALREIVAYDLPAPASEAASGAFDRDDPAVHTWGPVMVLPFIDPDTAVATVEMLGSTPETCSARVVVVDLRGTTLDQGFGAAALEQVLETISSWGAEPILTGVSSISEPAVADLEVAHCLLRKDIDEAIASAFQLADAQRHIL